ncbi:hypothetical protein [Alicyclobacillus sp.]|uniref:hypothetical protein n=1 Tax=Alicyclobacillus sp. TaxID=61169 RepID=UPI0025C58A00|nr:hypothetical protein [Alicyclobacillus sp.]MCL6517735.1 hypothetical protein [Alicyclobacillus sp.]
MAHEPSGLDWLRALADYNFSVRRCVPIGSHRARVESDGRTLEARRLPEGSARRRWALTDFCAQRRFRRTQRPLLTMYHDRWVPLGDGSVVMVVDDFPGAALQPTPEDATAAARHLARLHRAMAGAGELPDFADLPARYGQWPDRLRQGRDALAAERLLTQAAAKAAPFNLPQGPGARAPSREGGAPAPAERGGDAPGAAERGGGALGAAERGGGALGAAERGGGAPGVAERGGGTPATAEWVVWLDRWLDLAERALERLEASGVASRAREGARRRELAWNGMRLQGLVRLGDGRIATLQPLDPVADLTLYDLATLCHDVCLAGHAAGVDDVMDAYGEAIRLDEDERAMVRAFAAFPHHAVSWLRLWRAGGAGLPADWTATAQAHHRAATALLGQGGDAHGDAC